MARFKKKPVVVEADPYVKGMEDGFAAVRLGEVPDELLEAWYGDAVLKDAPPAQATAGDADGLVPEEGSILRAMDRRVNEPTFQVPYIGRELIRPTDMIVTSTAGGAQERYPVKKEVFEATYEPDPQGAMPNELDEANKNLTKATQDYAALGRFIMPIRNQLGALSERWEKGERTLQLCQEIMAVRVPQR